MKGMIKNIIFIVVIIVIGWFVVKYVRQYMGAKTVQTAVEKMQEGGMEQ